MYDIDRANLDIFLFYKKLPQQDREECEIFITPEKIWETTEPDADTCSRLKADLERMRLTSSKELTDSVGSRMEWSHYVLFNRFVEAIKEYIQLRPNMIEKYPEFLV